MHVKEDFTQCLEYHILRGKQYYFRFVKNCQTIVTSDIFSILNQNATICIQETLKMLFIWK